MSWLENLERDQAAGTKRIAALLDPDDLPSGREWFRFLDRLQNSAITDVFIGGSLLIKQNVADIIQSVRDRFDGPITIFPGAPDQVVKGADALLFLSLISGRNADLLIGRHVEAAMRIRKLNLEVVPTGYMLIGDGPLTTAAYMSNSLPIPYAKKEITVATAVAGEMLGLGALFLDAGSGAQQCISPSTIRAVRDAVQCPIIVGGGINDAAGIQAAWQAGCDLVVIGDAIENRPSQLDWLPHPEAFSVQTNPAEKRL
jgi:putative glycerol-1-phosphate prenyltransferase